MPVSRRDFLKMTGAGLGGMALPFSPVQWKPVSNPADDSASMLYDTTKCVGCRACQSACKRRAGLPYVPDASGLYEAPLDLSANTWTLIKLYQGKEGTSFVKAQCMHCVEPACVSVCPVGALEKTASGPVIYHSERCIGCRYCMTACPFGVPKTDWKAVFPLISKCDFCADRQAKGQAPSCGEACPTGALIYGKRRSMLDTAHDRLLKNKNLYVNKVYGEFEAGGTSMLYLSHVPFEKLGYPALSNTPLPELSWPYMAAVPGVIVVMSGLMTAIYLYTHRRKELKEA